MSCPDGLFFDSSLNVCNWPEFLQHNQYVHCQNQTNHQGTKSVQDTTSEDVDDTISEGEVICHESTDGYSVFVPHETNCSLYYQCVGLKPVIMMCPSELYFDSSLNVCNWPDNVVCGSPDEAVEEESDFDVVCHESDDGFPVFVPHPTACSLFYQCVELTPVLMECPDDLYFDTNLNVCNWPQYVDCSTHETTSETTTPEVTKTTTMGAAESTTSEVTRTATTGAAESTTPEVTETTSTEAAQTATPEVTETTTTIAAESTTPEVTETTTTDAAETTTPEVNETTTMGEDQTTTPKVTVTTTTEAAETTTSEITETTTLGVAQSSTPEVTETTTTEAAETTTPEISETTTMGEAQTSTPGVTGTTTTDAAETTTPEVTETTTMGTGETTTPEVTIMTTTEAAETSTPEVTETTTMEAGETTTAEVTETTTMGVSKTTTPEVSASSSETTTMNIVTTTTETFDAICQESENGFSVFVPHPTECSLYYQCVGLTAVLMECPDDLHFDTNLNVCNWPEYAGCNPQLVH